MSDETGGTGDGGAGGGGVSVSFEGMSQQAGVCLNQAASSGVIAVIVLHIRREHVSGGGAQLGGALPEGLIDQMAEIAAQAIIDRCA